MERELLEHLSKVPLPGYENLSVYFQAKYPKHEDLSMDIKVLLDELATERKLIRLVQVGFYSDLGSIKKVQGLPDETITFNTFDKLGYKISAKITLKGREYLIYLQRNEKQDQLNDSFKKLNDVTIPKNNFIQWGLTAAILLSSAIYTVVATLSYNESKRNAIKEECLKELEKKVQDKTTKDSIFQRAVKDSLNMK